MVIDDKVIMEYAFSGLLGPSQIGKLERWGFFAAPASRKHHHSYENGLFTHSREVAHILTSLTERNNLKWERPESPVIVGYLHDLCKCDQYLGGSTEWRHNPSPLLPGHGDKSVMLASTLLQLTMGEMLCIRFHMGFTEKDDWDFYSRIVGKFPNILWTHQADMISSKGVLDGMGFEYGKVD